MTKHREKPLRVWLLRTGTDDGPRVISDVGFERYPVTGWEPKFSDLYRVMGCNMVQLVRLDGLGDLWVDEEGLLQPVVFANHTATELVGEPIVGAAVLVPDPDVDETPRLAAAYANGVLRAKGSGS